jgi:phage protein D
LRFGPPREDREPEVELVFAPTSRLKRFSARLRTLTRGSEIEYRGWDVNRKDGISAKARRGDEYVIPVRGQQSGFEYSTGGFQASPAAVIDEVLVDDTDAQNLAKAAYRRSLRGFISGDGASVGNPQIRAGRTIRLLGLGPKFSGVYYVVASKHHFSARGYETTFEVRRPNL